MSDFFRTHMGRRFYTATMPQIADALTEIAKNTSKEETSFEDLMRHVGHDIKCVTYGKDGKVYNVAIECETCNEVIINFDK